MQNTRMKSKLERPEDIIKWIRTIIDDKSIWPKVYPEVVQYLSVDNNKVLAKTLWLIGEIGLKYPNLIENSDFKKIVVLMDYPEAKIREMAVHAFGRIGRNNQKIVEAYITKLLSLTNDDDENVRMNAVWASENIAINTPELFENKMDTFYKLLEDKSDKVRMEAPEIFRVMGKKNPQYIYDYKLKLEKIANEDKNEVVRLHAQAALKTIRPLRKA